MSSNSKDHCTLQIENDEDAEFLSVDIVKETSVSHKHIVEVGLFQAGLEQIWKGKPLTEMCKLYDAQKELLEVESGNSHTVLFQIPLMVGVCPSAQPAIYEDFWDTSHVKMPCSESNIYPMKSEGKSFLKQRWNLVQFAFSKFISNSLDLEKAILSYNSRYDGIWNFQGLHTLFSKVLSHGECERFFYKTLPGIISLALKVSSCVTQSPILLVRQKCHSISLSQLQIASLLANAFLCTYPRRNTQKKQSEFSTFPDINFVRLFENKSKSSWINEKLKCIIHYFERVTQQEPTGVVTFTRQVISGNDLPNWEYATETVPGFHVSSEGTIEKEGSGLLQIDFANRFVGGGVLGWGCVQEEIRFITCPELIAARLFTEALENNEALVITGCEQYCEHSGYSSTFCFRGDYNDTTTRDAFGRRLCKLIAIDAVKFRHQQSQYEKSFLLRELNKAYAGFYCPQQGSPLAAIATGNWGCGAYHGDPRLKCLLQLMAAAKAGRDVVYFTFGDRTLRDDLFDMYSLLKMKSITVGFLFKLLCQYGEQFAKCDSPSLDLYGYLYAVLDSIDSEDESVEQKTVTKIECH